VIADLAALVQAELTDDVGELAQPARRLLPLRWCVASMRDRRRDDVGARAWQRLLHKDIGRDGVGGRMGRVEVLETSRTRAGETGRVHARPSGVLTGTGLVAVRIGLLHREAEGAVHRRAIDAGRVPFSIGLRQVDCGGTGRVEEVLARAKASALLRARRSSVAGSAGSEVTADIDEWRLPGPSPLAVCADGCSCSEVVAEDTLSLVVADEPVWASVPGCASGEGKPAHSPSKA
jgi:hypothetical protein